MAFDLLTPKGNIFINDVDWTMILKLAKDFGYIQKSPFINRKAIIEIVNVLRTAIVSIPEDNALPTRSRPAKISEIGNMAPPTIGVGR